MSRSEHGGRPDDAVGKATRRMGVGSLALRILLPVVLLGAGVVGFTKLSKKAPLPPVAPPEAKSLEVRVEKMTRVDFQVVVPSRGVVQAHSQVSLTPQVAGRIQVLHPEFETGAFFKAGDILVELDPIDFDVAVVAAEAQVAQAKLALAQEEARAEQARLDWADLGYKTEPGELVRREPQLKAARENLKLAEAQGESARRNRERARIRAPFDGRVLTRTAGLGQTVGAATPLGEIFATDYSEVRLPVSSRHRVDLSLPEDLTDAPVEVRLKDGLLDGSGHEWDAMILRTEGALDARTLDLFAIARIEDPYGLKSEKAPLRIGQPVEASIPGRTLKGVFVIPREAVANLSRIRVVDPATLVLGTAHVVPVWSDDERLVFQDEKIADGTLLVTTKLVYAPDGGRVVLVEDDDPALLEDEEPKSGEETTRK